MSRWISARQNLPSADTVNDDDFLIRLMPLIRGRGDRMTGRISDRPDTNFARNIRSSETVVTGHP